MHGGPKRPASLRAAASDAILQALAKSCKILILQDIRKILQDIQISCNILQDLGSPPPEFAPESIDEHTNSAANTPERDHECAPDPLAPSSPFPRRPGSAAAAAVLRPADSTSVRMRRHGGTRRPAPGPARPCHYKLMISLSRAQFGIFAEISKLILPQRHN
jgi:hypothetical protein